MRLRKPRQGTYVPPLIEHKMESLGIKAHAGSPHRLQDDASLESSGILNHACRCILRRGGLRHASFEGCSPYPHVALHRATQRPHLESGCIIMHALRTRCGDLMGSFETPNQKAHIEMSTPKIMQLQGVICIPARTKSACGNCRRDLRASA